MNVIDIVILAIFGICLVSGMYKGFIASGLTVLGFIVAWFAAKGNVWRFERGHLVQFLPDGCAFHVFGSGGLFPQRANRFRHGHGSARFQHDHLEQRLGRHPGTRLPFLAEGVC